MTHSNHKEKELYDKWKKEHPDCLHTNIDTPAEWFIRNYVESRLLPFLNKETTPSKEAGEVKDLLLETHKEYQHRNGRPSCKNCGINHEKLWEMIEKLLIQAEQKGLEQGRREVLRDIKIMTVQDKDGLEYILIKDIESYAKSKGIRV